MNPKEQTLSPVRELLETLPPGYRERALWNMEHVEPFHNNEPKATLYEALARGFVWEKTKEGYDFWRDVKQHYYTDFKTPLPPLPEGSPHDVEDSHATATTNNTTPMPDYTSTPVATPTLVYGEDVAGMTEARCMQIIKALKAEAKDLAELGVESATVTKRIEERNAAIAAVLVRLDSFAS